MVLSSTSGPGRADPIRSPVDGVRLWSLDLRPAADDSRLAALGAHDHARWSRLGHLDAARLLARRALLRTVVADLADCSPAAVASPLTEGPRRVEVPDGRSWFVSVSSTDRRGLLAVAGVPVGVDVEGHPGPPDALLVSAQLLPRSEHAWVRSGGDRAAERFLDTWVRKEAVVKCTGEGLRRDLRSFCVDAGAEASEVVLLGAVPLPVMVFAVDYPGCSAAVAVGSSRGVAAPGD